MPRMSGRQTSRSMLHEIEIGSCSCGSARSRVARRPLARRSVSPGRSRIEVADLAQVDEVAQGASSRSMSCSRPVGGFVEVDVVGLQSCFRLCSTSAMISARVALGERVFAHLPVGTSSRVRPGALDRREGLADDSSDSPWEDTSAVSMN